MNKRLTSRVLALLLVMLMSFTQMPFTAYAAIGDPSDDVDFSGTWTADYKSLQWWGLKTLSLVYKGD